MLLWCLLGIVPALIVSGDCGICFRFDEAEDGVVGCGGVEISSFGGDVVTLPLVYRLFAVVVVESVEDDLVQCRKGLSQL